MSLYLFNSLSQKKEVFKPLNKGQVLMYVCGITPYDTTHLGHAFTYIHFDVLQRFLKFLGYQVNYTQNVTDVDDDIFKKAKETGRDWQELGNFWINRFLEDLRFLNIEIPNNYVKATDSIPTIIKIVSRLMDKSFAYVREGNVYFEVSKFKNYGRLSKLSEVEMIKLSAQRGANPKDPLKKHPLDFVLWQKSSKSEPFWVSPWPARNAEHSDAGGSRGRPGWHIECSAMIMDYLGSQIDIHGGGGDLIYPHHESEIAQSESYSGKSPFAKFWMHTGMLEYEGEKMSKSLGNLVLVSGLAKKYSANAIRWLLLSHHYREVWAFSYSQLDKAQKTVDRIDNLVAGHPEIKDQSNIPEIENFMNDGLDTPKLLEFMELTSASSKKLDILCFIYEFLGFKVSG